MKRQIQKQKTSVILIITRSIMLGVAIISTIAIIFPALFGALFISNDIQIDPLEPGAWTFHVLIANLAVLSFTILYYKNLLPKFTRNSLNFILNFDVSNKLALIAIGVILSIYISLTYEELFLNEQDQWADFVRIKMVIDGWPYTPDVIPQMTLLHVKNFLLKVSLTVFQNIKIVPFMGTIALLLVTYFFTVQLTKKRFSGLVAIVITLLSFTFLRYDTLATYANFWTLFFILSLYLINKTWILSPISFLLSLLCKPLTVAFLPFSFFFIYNTKMKKNKTRVTILYTLIVIMLVGALYLGVDPGGSISIQGIQNVDFGEFVAGFAAWSYQLRFDYLILMFYLPLTVGLILVARSGIKEADSILVLMGGTLLAAPLLAAFTGFNVFPYRYIPLIIFFSIGVGILLSRRITRRASK